MGELATRTAHIATDFLLNGGNVNTITETGIAQNFVHVGAQNWNLAAGLEFDTVSMVYDLLAINTLGTTTINTALSIFASFGASDRPFFNSPDVSYNTAQVVPLPAALPMLVAGLAGLGFIGRRRKQKLSAAA